MSNNIKLEIIQMQKKKLNPNKYCSCILDSSPPPHFKYAKPIVPTTIVINNWLNPHKAFTETAFILFSFFTKINLPRISPVRLGIIIATLHPAKTDSNALTNGRNWIGVSNTFHFKASVAQLININKNTNQITAWDKDAFIWFQLSFKFSCCCNCRYK